MVLAVLMFLAVSLTIAMFTAKEPLLAWPSVIAWMILGAHSYLLSTVPWGDIYYYMFIAFALGMTTFCMLSAFAIRRLENWSPEVVDVDKETKTTDAFGDGNGNGSKEDNDDGVQPSRRTQELRKRATQRRTHGVSRRDR